MKPRKLSTILAGTHGDLAKLLHRAEKIAGLTGLVRDALPEPVAAHVVAASLRDGCLTVLADSPVWAARLRYVDPGLGKRLEEFGVTAERIKIRVRAPGDRPGD
jgi:hypothetical protein